MQYWQPATRETTRARLLRASVERIRLVFLNDPEILQAIYEEAWHTTVRAWRKRQQVWAREKAIYQRWAIYGKGNQRRAHWLKANTEACPSYPETPSEPPAYLTEPNPSPTRFIQLRPAKESPELAHETFTVSQDLRVAALWLIDRFEYSALWAKEWWQIGTRDNYHQVGPAQSRVFRLAVEKYNRGAFPVASTIVEAVQQNHAFGLTPDASDEDIRNRARELANERRCRLAFVNACIRQEGPWCPLNSPALSGWLPATRPELLRELDECWWRRKIRLHLRRWRGTLDHLIDAPGRDWHYVSRRAARERREQNKRNEEILKRTEILCIDENGSQQTHTLGELAEGKLERRRAELMCRAYGLSQLAQAEDLQPFFVTLTCPSRMHPNSQRYDSTMPHQAVTWLTGQLSRWYDRERRECKSRQPLRSYFIRSLEPHKDGTPHIHMVIWTDDEDRLRDQLDYYFRRYPGADGDEPGALKRRVVIEAAERGHGGAVSYITKYVLKHTIGLPGEANTTIDIDAWRSQWGNLHSFDFGSTCDSLGPVSLWRELRRLKPTATTPEGELIYAQDSGINEAAKAAHANDYAAFTRLTRQGLLKLDRDESRHNQYEEIVDGPVIVIIRQPGGSP